MSGGGDEKTTTTSSQQPWEGQQPYLRSLYQKALTARDTHKSYYPGETYVTRQADQLAAQNQVRGLAGDNALVGMAEGQSNATMAGDYFGQSPADAENPYLDAAFNRSADNLGQAFTRNVLPSIAARYSASGQVGSPDELAAYGRAQEGLSEGMSDLAVNTYMPAYENQANRRMQAFEGERNRQITALQMAPALNESRFYGANQMNAYGAEDQQDRQSLVDSWIARYEYDRDEPDRRNVRYANLLNGNPGMSGFSETKGSGGGSDQTTQALQAAAMMAAMFMSSDERLKESIEPIDSRAILSELGAKQWAYRESGRRGMGPMAQELERTPLAHAVIDTPHGKVVDYGALVAALFALVTDVSKRLERIEARLPRES